MHKNASTNASSADSAHNTIFTLAQCHVVRARACVRYELITLMAKLICERIAEHKHYKFRNFHITQIHISESRGNNSYDTGKYEFIQTE